MVPDNNPSPSAVTNKNSVCMHREQPIHSLLPEVYLSPVHVRLGNLIRNHVVSSNTMLLFVPNDPETFPPILVHLCFLWFAGTWPSVISLAPASLPTTMVFRVLPCTCTSSMFPYHKCHYLQDACSLLDTSFLALQHTSLGVSCTTALLSINTPGTRTTYPRESQNGLTDNITNNPGIVPVLRQWEARASMGGGM